MRKFIIAGAKLCAALTMSIEFAKVVSSYTDSRLLVVAVWAIMFWIWQDLLFANPDEDE